MVLPSSAPSTMTLSPRCPAAGVCGSRSSTRRRVSSYKASLPPEAVFSVHLAASAKASSGVQLPLMITPDHDAGPVALFCALFSCPRPRAAAAKSASAEIRIGVAIVEVLMEGMTLPHFLLIQLGE